MYQPILYSNMRSIFGCDLADLSKANILLGLFLFTFKIIYFKLDNQASWHLTLLDPTYIWSTWDPGGGVLFAQPILA